MIFAFSEMKFAALFKLALDAFNYEQGFIFST